MAPWPRAPVIPQLVDRKTFRDNRWVRHLSLTNWGTLNSREAASPLVRLMEEEVRWEVSDHLHGVFPQNFCRTDPKRNVTYMVLKAKTNNKRMSSLCRDEFRGPLFDNDRQVAFVTATTT
ncbi:uncharacterized protein TNCV_1333091 [Trichonephila clavipes]|nr:uncharacterized protein TNCV_1333091 [Trichonephila clavipes]